MYFIYIDETGNTGADVSGDQPIHMLGASVIHTDKVRVVEDALNELAKGISEDCDAVEFKGSWLANGKAHFKGMAPSERIDLTRQILEIAAESLEAFGYAGVDKRKSFASDHPQVISMTLLLERLQSFLRARKTFGLIIADEYNELGDSLIEEYERFKRTGTKWGYAKVKLHNVIDSLHYVKSRHSRLLQVSDIMTYVTITWMRIYENAQKKMHAEGVTSLDYSEWLDTNLTRSEQATRELYKISDKVMRFRAKVFPA